jgi:hypothetical protein
VVEVQLLYATVLKPYIFILVKEDQAEPVLHKILYSQEAEKQIMRAMGQARRGVKMLLKPSESDSQGNEDLKFYQFDHKASEPKVP